MSKMTSSFDIYNIKDYPTFILKSRLRFSWILNIFPQRI